MPGCLRQVDFGRVYAGLGGLRRRKEKGERMGLNPGLYGRGLSVAVIIALAMVASGCSSVGLPQPLDGITFLNGKSDPIHNLGASAPFSVDTRQQAESYLSYLRFFSAAIFDEYGDFSNCR
jgi:hypothetical protein